MEKCPFKKGDIVIYNEKGKGVIAAHCFNSELTLEFGNIHETLPRHCWLRKTSSVADFNWHCSNWHYLSLKEKKYSNIAE